MSARKILALDFGSGSMRAIQGTFDGYKLSVCEIGRSQNRTLSLKDGLYWDIGKMYNFAMDSIIDVGNIDSVGVDTWGADLGLIGSNGEMLSIPRSYRDPALAETASEIMACVSDYELYQSNGAIIDPICPLISLCHSKKLSPRLFDAVDRIQLMASMMAYLLTGRTNFDRTLASLSGFYNVASDKWNLQLLEKLGLDNVLSSDQERRRVIGNIRGTDIPVIQVLGHDTASALLALPTHKRQETFYIASGSWVMAGCFNPDPIITPASFAARLSNENGYDGEINFLRYINGLYIFQQCAREWAENEGYCIDYAELEKCALERDYEGTIDPDSEEFGCDGYMNEKVAANVVRRNHPAPADKIETYMAIYNGITEKICTTYRDVCRLTGRTFTRVQIVGGGSQSRYFVRCIEKSLGLPVYAGPAEASAIGNLCMQLIAQGELSNADEVGEMLQQSLINNTAK